MARRISTSASIVALALLATACVTTRPLRQRSSALEYLYPQGKAEATPPSDVTLRVPVRVGLAFAPSGTTLNDAFSETRKQSLLQGIADAFREEAFVGRIEVLPSVYLTPSGSFEEVDRLASAFGLDLIVLVSYDQHQFTETTNTSWTYLTVLGAYVVRGEKNETRTLMDAVIYDIPSRALLFRAAGDSSLKDRSTPVKVDRRLRQESERGFDQATDELIGNLRAALESFREQVESGTVRGAGTPAVQVVDAATGESLAGRGYGGALGVVELGGVGAMLVVLAAARRRRPSGGVPCA